MSLRRLLAAASILLVSATAAACGSSSGTAEPAASGSAKPDAGADALVVYSGRNEKLVSPLLDKLKAATGRDVQVRYGDSAELAAQILEEGERTRADLFFSQDAGALGALSKQGLLAPVAQPSLDKVSEKYRGTDWVGVSGRSRVLVYDPRAVQTPPKSVFELTDAKWRGKVAWAPTNASFQAFVTGLRVLKGDAAAKDWLDGMKANETQTFKSNAEILDAVDAGKIQVGLINHYYWYAKTAEKGSIPSKLAFLPGGDPGALVNVAGVGVLKTTKHAEAAQKAVDYLLSADAQQYFAKTTKEYPLAAGVEADQGLPKLDTLTGPAIDLAKLESLEQTLKLLQDTGVV
ncbi:iron ABC transporter substrate-binding protein [Nonomuraea longicatena]|uniref:Iron ABC transporter substrate-binding protein n=1 Tax=Nonomuraea longicatena TaxID=83682 RepID=A0ABN1P2E2_9ACTN